MSEREITTFWARRIRFGLIAGRTPAMWPVFVFLPVTRRAFYRSFHNRRQSWRYAGLDYSRQYRAERIAYWADVEARLRFWERRHGRDCA